MESELLGQLAQYGPLGLWTASLLWMNWQMRKDQKESEKQSKESLEYHQEQIVSRLADQERMLEKAIEKIDDGIGTMKEKYAEERMFRLRHSISPEKI